MPEADRFDAPQGGTIYGELLTVVSEAVAGNGITSTGDAVASAGSGDFDVDISSAVDFRFAGASFDVPAETVTLSDPPTSTTNGQEDRRADLVYVDADTEAYAVSTGTPGPNPEPPDTPDAGLLVAVVTVEHAVDEVVDDDILNWSARAAVDFPVTSAEIQTDAVTSDTIAVDAVTATQIAAGAVGTDQIEDGAVTDAKLGGDVTTTVSVRDDGVVIDDEVSAINFGDGLDVAPEEPGRVTVSVDPDVIGADEPLAQMLSRRQKDISATRIEEASGVSAPKAQVLARRNSA